MCSAHSQYEEMRMGYKKTRGLIKRAGIWHISKQLFGQRIRGSTGTSDIHEAEVFLAKRVEEVRQSIVYGVRPKRSFKEAATKYLLEKRHKSSIELDAYWLKKLNEYIGHLPLESVHMGTLQPFIHARQREGVKNRTINACLEVVRHLLKLAASRWLDENGLTWLRHAPIIEMLSRHDERKPYPLSWSEQEKLFAHLSQHLRQMALFAVNTGCRDRVVCSLRWEWEFVVPELNTSVFVIPAEVEKNRIDRLVVLNDIAKAIIEEQRDKHPEFVFVYKGHPVSRMNNSCWKKARKKAELPWVRVHDLKHTFGRRLRAAGVSYEDRQDLLGHKSARVTTHYSAAEIKNLMDAANLVCKQNGNTPTLTLLRSTANLNKIATKLPQ